MKQTKRVKTLLMVALIAVLLTAAISGTIAWLVTSSGPVVNTFKPVEVETDTNEDFDDETGAKKSVTIVNTGDIPVYVRVAVVGNWVKAGKVVGNWTLTDDYINKTDWFISGGYYYHKNEVAVNGSTAELLANPISTATRDDGAHLEVTVIHQSIQSQPDEAVENAWGVNANNGTISK